MKTRWNWLPIALMFFAYAGYGQETIPQGTVIPARLNATLSFNNAKPNQNISARVMQDVPLPNGMKIREGVRITGHVIEVRSGTQGANPSILFAFDHVRISKHSIPMPITTDLRALASFTAVEEAGIPLTSSNIPLPLGIFVLSRPELSSMTPTGSVLPACAILKPLKP